ncbi:lipid kinase YegS [Methylobacterium organophilum]|uniref:Lipid kinase YegS n=1 Tax=Methylobacterium organophilum TaxID=410 RepID=A0ABQ4T1J4_METOR|nr:lipid kinase YegS [Methylobacterium organophilum]
MPHVNHGKTAPFALALGPEEPTLSVPRVRAPLAVEASAVMSDPRWSQRRRGATPDASGPLTASSLPERRALLIVNPKARNGAAPLDEIRAALRAGGITPIEPEPDDCVALIERHARACDLVVLGGGDGTMNHAAPALVASGLPLGILPLGTANDLARSLQIPLDPVAAARTIVTNDPKPVDLGWVNGHYYFNVASIGFSADLAGELTADAKKKWGTVGYAIAAFRLLRRARPFTVTIEHDGQTEKVVTIQASVGNGRHYGGGMTVSESATVDDGKLDFYSLEVAHWWRLLALLPALRRGTQGEAADVRAFRTTEIRLTTRKPRPVNTDGELTTQTPAHFKVVPRAVRIFAPEHGTRPPESRFPLPF